MIKGAEMSGWEALQAKQRAKEARTHNLVIMGLIACYGVFMFVLCMKLPV